MYKKSKQLGRKDDSLNKSGMFVVEISSSNNSLFVAAFDVDSPESLLIELDGTKSVEILQKFNNDYESMASSLQVMNKRLVLLNPKFV